MAMAALNLDIWRLCYRIVAKVLPKTQSFKMFPAGEARKVRLASDSAGKSRTSFDTTS
jgi:hypothetical protein